MHFSLIFTLDLPGGVPLKPYLPTRRHLFITTEASDRKSDYSYLEGRWRRGKHRRLVALLSRAEFERFLDDTGLLARPDETLGSLGAPGCGFSRAPAILFNAEHDEVIASAYVTPVPDIRHRTGKADRPENWERAKNAVLELYGYDRFRPSTRRSGRGF